MESLRNYASDLAADVLEQYGTVTASAAVDLFDEVMAAEGLSVRGSMPSGIFTRDELSAIAHYQAGKLRTDDVDGFVEQVSRSIGHLVYQGANRAMYWQSGYYTGIKTRESEYSQEVRYARVPQGAETCDFCLMLASRGFVYVTEETASHSHRNCDCVVVPGLGHHDPTTTPTSMGDWVQDTEIEGLDLEALRAMYPQWKEISERYGMERDSEAARQEKLDVMEEELGRRQW